MTDVANIDDHRPDPLAIVVKRLKEIVARQKQIEEESKALGAEFNALRSEAYHLGEAEKTLRKLMAKPK